MGNLLVEDHFFLSVQVSGITKRNTSVLPDHVAAVIHLPNLEKEKSGAG
jgi:hypothetical protein